MRSLPETWAILFAALVFPMPFVSASSDNLDPSFYAIEANPSVPPGFRATLFAREPQVRNPAAITFDANGRLFVGQGPQFRHPKEDTPGDEIVLLEDTDLDGAADKFKIFAYGFNSVQGLAWKGDDLWVANAPDLTVVRDLDGDDVADEYRLIYSGLGTLEHALHGLNWGPDGLLYLSKGDTPVLPEAPRAFRDLAHVPSNAPDTQPIRVYQSPDSPSNPYRKTYIVPTDPHTEGGILRCDENGEQLEIFARGMRNPYDICFDSEFNWLGTDNDQDGGDRLLMPFYGAHFGHRHPWSYHWTGENHPPTVPVSGPFFHGSGTGVVFYDGPRFPEPYRNVFFIGDWLKMKVYVYRPRWEGALLQPADPDLAVIAESGAERSLFRPTDLAVGPDGALFVSSWGFEYGARWDDSGLQANEGRIYKIEPQNASYSETDNSRSKEKRSHSDSTFEELVADFEGPVLARRVNAQDELVRRGEKVRPLIEDMLPSNELSVTQRTWLVWALGRIATEDFSIDQYFLNRIEDFSNPIDMRIQSLRILGRRARTRGASRPLPEGITKFLKDEDPRLRFETVQAIWQSHGVQSTQPLLEALAVERDPLVYYSLWGALRDLSSAEERKSSLAAHPSPAVRFGMLLGLLETAALSGEEVARILESDDDPRIQTWVSSWIANVGHGLEDPAKVIEKLLELNLRGINYELRMNLLAALEQMEVRGEDWTNLYEGFYVNHKKGEIYVPEKSQEVAACLRVLAGEERALPILWEALDHEWEPARQAAIESFRRLGEEGREFLLARLGTAEGRRLEGAVEALGRFHRRTEPWALTEDQVLSIENGWNRSRDALFRQNALRLLIQAAPRTWGNPRPETAAASLVKSAITDADPRISLLGEELARMVGMEVFAARREPATVEEVLMEISAADSENGKVLYYEEGGRAACYRCHQIHGRGNSFAPDLSDTGGRLDARKMAESILTPSSEITEGFRAWLVETIEGESLTGVIVEETDSFLKLVQSDGVALRIAKDEVVGRRNLETSIMPSNYAELLTTREVADLIAWLMTAREESEIR